MSKPTTLLPLVMILIVACSGPQQEPEAAESSTSGFTAQVVTGPCVAIEQEIIYNAFPDYHIEYFHAPKNREGLSECRINITEKEPGEYQKPAAQLMASLFTNRGNDLAKARSFAPDFVQVDWAEAVLTNKQNSVLYFKKRGKIGRLIFINNRINPPDSLLLQLGEGMANDVQ